MSGFPTVLCLHITWYLDDQGIATCETCGEFLPYRTWKNAREEEEDECSN